jgi:hypothetical protein
VRARDPGVKPKPSQLSSLVSFVHVKLDIDNNFEEEDFGISRAFHIWASKKAVAVLLGRPTPFDLPKRHSSDLQPTLQGLFRGDQEERTISKGTRLRDTRP